MKVIRNWTYKTMNLILSTGVECHESHQELKIQDNESYTEYWCRMSWKSSGTENTRQWIEDSLSCIFSSWWLSWHSTPVLSIRFIVLYFQFLMTFMTFYTSTLYKIHCLVFSVCHESHQELKIQDNESYTEYWCRMSWKSSGTENTRQWILY
jgi:hypothetical protein